jgi:hypothetical protein
MACLTEISGELTEMHLPLRERQGLGIVCKPVNLLCYVATFIDDGLRLIAYECGVWWQGKEAR